MANKIGVDVRQGITEMMSAYLQEMQDLEEIRREEGCSTDLFAECRGNINALEVTAKGLANTLAFNLSDIAVFSSIRALINGLGVCVELNTKHYVDEAKPWVSSWEKLRARTQIARYNTIISQLDQFLRDCQSERILLTIKLSATADDEFHLQTAQVFIQMPDGFGLDYVGDDIANRVMTLRVYGGLIRQQKVHLFTLKNEGIIVETKEAPEHVGGTE